MQRVVFFILFLSLTSCFFGNRPFPKRFLGEYEAEQEAYEVNLNGDAVKVPATQLDLKLEYNNLWLTTPNQVVKGTYEIKAETKQYYTFKVELENGVVEEWQLHRKGKKIIRKAISPQPVTIFLKE
ncbi:MAG: hypothetical protein WEA99_11490 [Brumimicrobium sp.]